jgi:hypothetical protein
MGRAEHTFDPSVAGRNNVDRSTAKAYLLQTVSL